MLPHQVREGCQTGPGPGGIGEKVLTNQLVKTEVWPIWGWSAKAYCPKTPKITACSVQILQKSRIASNFRP